jgi:hypothetical protein
MKKRRPSHENPFYTKKYRSENVPEIEMPASKKRYCRKEKCGEILPPEKYFYCKKCEKNLPSDNGMDSLYYRSSK